MMMGISAALVMSSMILGISGALVIEQHALVWSPGVVDLTVIFANGKCSLIHATMHFASYFQLKSLRDSIWNPDH